VPAGLLGPTHTRRRVRLRLETVKSNNSVSRWSNRAKQHFASLHGLGPFWPQSGHERVKAFSELDAIR